MFLTFHCPLKRMQQRTFSLNLNNNLGWEKTSLHTARTASVKRVMSVLLEHTKNTQIYLVSTLTPLSHGLS